MKKSHLGLAVSITIATTIICSIVALSSVQLSTAGVDLDFKERKAPIAVSWENIYVTWRSNKRGNEVMFKTYAYGRTTFGIKINLSNTNASESVDAQITVSGDNVIIS